MPRSSSRSQSSSCARRPDFERHDLGSVSRHPRDLGDQSFAQRGSVAVQPLHPLRLAFEQLQRRDARQALVAAAAVEKMKRAGGVEQVLAQTRRSRKT